MKCDKLEARTIYVDCLGRTIVYFDPYEVNEAIKEIKQKLQDQCISCPVKMQEDDVVAELKAENEKLKAQFVPLYEELKAFTFGLGQNLKDGSPCVVAFDDENNPRLASDEKFYIKSEADKVIAELKADYKEACDRLQTANLIKDEQLAATRHQKYRRCLAMVKYCEAMRGHYLSYEEPKWFWYREWSARWLELAEKFKDKEAK